VRGPQTPMPDKYRAKELLAFLAYLYYNKDPARWLVDFFIKIVELAEQREYFAFFGIRTKEEYRAAWKCGRLYELLDLWRRERLTKLWEYKTWLIPRSEHTCFNSDGQFSYLCPFCDPKKSECIYLKTRLFDFKKECSYNLRYEPELIFVDSELTRRARELERCGRKSDFVLFCDLASDLIAEGYDLCIFADLFAKYGSYVCTRESAVVLLFLAQRCQDERAKRILDEKIDTLRLLDGYGLHPMDIEGTISIAKRGYREPKEFESKKRVLERYRRGVIYLETGLPWICEQVMLDRAFIACYPRSENEVLEADAYLVEIYHRLDGLCKAILRSAYRAAETNLDTKCHRSIRTKVRRAFAEMPCESIKKRYVDSLALDGIDRLLFELECDVDLGEGCYSVRDFRRWIWQKRPSLEQRQKFRALERRWEK